MSETQQPDGDGGTGTPNLRLLDMDAGEAQQQYREGELTDAEFERWATLNDLEDDMDALKSDVAQAERNVIEGSIEADGDALVDSGEWYGVEITYKLELEGWMDGVLNDLDDKTGETLTGEDLREVKDDVAELLTVLWREVETDAGMQDLTEYDDAYVRDWIMDNWINNAEVGLRGAYLCLVDQIQHATRREREMQAQTDKFRGEAGSADGGAPPADERLDDLGAIRDDLET